MKLWWLGVLLVGAALFLLNVDFGKPGESVPIITAGTAYSTESYASIQHEIFIGDPRKPVLFVLEENHAALAVQAEVALAIESIWRAGLTPTLLVEGSKPERLNLSEIFIITNETFRLAAAEAWFELGWLSGAEMAVLRIPELPVHGIEDPMGMERTQHLEAINGCSEALDKLYLETSRLYEQLRNRNEPLETVDAVKTGFEDAYSALAEPIEGEMRFSNAVSVLEKSFGRGLSIHGSLEQLQLEFAGIAEPYSVRKRTFKEARYHLFAEIVKTAKTRGLDTKQAEDLLDQYKQADSDEASACEARDRAMIANAMQILSEQGCEVGIMVAGAGHTAALKKFLQEQEISYFVITPLSLSLNTPRREIDWFSRARENGETLKISPPLLGWLGEGIYKASMILSYPEARKSLATVITILDVVDQALNEDRLHLYPDTLITDVQTSLALERLELTFEGIGGRRLSISLPQDFQLTPTAAKELSKHLGEADQARDELSRYPAVHMYLDSGENGMHGGAFVSYVEGETLYVQGANFESLPSVDSVVEAYKADMLGSLAYLNLNPEVVRNGEPADLLAPLRILNPIVEVLDQVLDHLGIPDGQIMPVALRLAAPAGTYVSPFREVDFTLLAMLARFAGIEGYERRLLFVNSGLETDSELIKVGGWEHLLPMTLANIARWGATERHLAIFTAPTSKEDWNTENPLAEHLRGENWTWDQYESQVLPNVRQAIEALGRDNVLEPRNIDEFLEGLQLKLLDCEDATITLTLVAHRLEGGKARIHFKDKNSDVLMSDVIRGIRWLQDKELIPASVDLEFTVLVCSVGAEGAEEFFKQLGSPLVIASPNPISLSTNMVLLAKVAEKMKQEGKPLWQAYFEVKEWFVQELLIKSPAELEAEGIRYLETPGVISEVDPNDSSA